MINKKLVILSFTMICLLSGCFKTDNNTIIEDENITKEATTKIEETNNTESKEILKEEKSISPLLYIMPQYKNILYSRAYLRKYVEKELKELRECYGKLADSLNNENMSNTEKSIALKNYKMLEEFLLLAEKNMVDEEKYESLKKTDYIDYIKQNTVYDNEMDISHSNYVVKLETIENYDLFYSFECDVKRPYLISKNDVNKLKEIYKQDEEEATTILEMPINKDDMISSRDNITVKKLKLYYDGDKGFLYYKGGKEIDNNLREISIREYDNDYYAFYEDDYWPIEQNDKNIKISVLKDANIGEGDDFEFISIADDDYNLGDDDFKYYFNIEDLFRRLMDNEKTFLGEKTEFNANYVKFDKKGYVVDIYNFTE